MADKNYIDDFNFISESLSTCPYCGSDEIESQGVDYEWSDFNPKEMAEPVRCLECGRHWTDVFVYHHTF